MKRLVALLTLLATAPALAQDDLPLAFIVPEPSTLIVGDREADLPPGVFLPAEAFLAVDNRIKALENDNTRLNAENEVLRQKPVGVKGLLIAAGVGVLLGAGAAYLVSK